MSIWNWFPSRSKRFKLTTHDRKLIWKWFGSFDANAFAMNDGSFIEESYETNVDFYSVINKVVNTSKMVPWIVEQRQSDGTWEIIEDTTLHELMAQPNMPKQYTWDDIQEQQLVYLLVAGNSYMVGNTQLQSSLIEEVDILPSQFVDITANGDFFLPAAKYTFELESTKRTYESDELEHTRLFNPGYQNMSDGLLGLSIVQVARMVIQTGNSKWEANASIFQNRGALGIVTDKTNRPMTPSEANDAQDKLDHRIGGSEKYGRTLVTNKDLNYIQLAMSPADLQLLESGVVSLRSICNALGVDSSLFNDPGNRTLNNLKEAEKNLYRNTIIPLSERIAAKHTIFLAKNHFPEGNVRMRQDFSNVAALQEDFNEKSKTLVSLKSNGIITANEARGALDKDMIIDENADKLIITNNNILQEDIDAGTNTGGE